MKPPTPAPSLEDVMAKATPALMAKAMERAMKGADAAESAYFHWEDLKYRPPPAGIATREEWWTMLQCQRLFASRELAGLVDKTGVPWRAVLTPAVQAQLSAIDRQLTVRVLTDAPDATAPGVRDQFVVEYLTQEAWASSFIEGASATREQARDMVEKNRAPRDNAERMILNNYKALGQARAWKDQPLTPEMVLNLQEILVEGTDVRPGDAGRLRLRPVVISTPENEVLHEPPDFTELPARLKALCDFANAQDGLHPVVRAVALHFMLAYDHPFGDGNGRTARALFYWAMLRAGYGLVEFMPISDVIRRAHAQYGRAFLLAETDNQDFTHFLAYHLRLLEQAGERFTARMKERRAKEEELAKAVAVPGLNGRQASLLKRMLLGEVKHTSFDAHAKDHGVTYLTARKDLEGMLAQDLIEERPKEGKRRLFAPGAKVRRKAVK